MPAERLEALLPEMELLIGQSDMPKARLDRARKLRAHHQRRDQFPAERRLRDLLRARHPCAHAELGLRPAGRRDGARHGDRPLPRHDAADRAMRAGDEKWLLDGAEGCFSLYGARVGLIGFGDLARAFTPLLAPFGCPIKAYDPWVSDHFMAGLRRRRRLARGGAVDSQVIVVFAAVTSENQGFLGKREFELIDAGLGLPADEPRRRRRFPRVPAPGRERPLPRRDRRLPRRARAARRPARKVEGLLLSPHRAGAMTEALYEIGRQTVADAELILRGLPPLSCRRAQRETVARSRRSRSSAVDAPPLDIGRCRGLVSITL